KRLGKFKTTSISSQIEITLSAIAVTCCEFMLYLLTLRTAAAMSAGRSLAGAYGGRLLWFVSTFYLSLVAAFNISPAPGIVGPDSATSNPVSVLLNNAWRTISRDVSSILFSLTNDK